MPPHRHKRQRRETISPPQLHFASALPQRISHPDVFSQPSASLASKRKPIPSTLFIMAPPPPRRPAPPAPTMPTPTSPTHSAHPSDASPQTQPAFFNADALQSLNGGVTHNPAPRAARDPVRRRAGAFQKLSPRTPRTLSYSSRSPCSPGRTPRTPRRRCSAMATGSPQRYKTVGEASVDRALGSMMHSLRLAASSPGREISRWSSSTDGSSSGAASSFASFFRGKTQSADAPNSTADTSLASTANSKPSDTSTSNIDSASITSVKSAHSLRSVRSFASFRSARSAKSVAAASTKSARSMRGRKWHWGHKDESEVPPIPVWHADAPGHFAESSGGSSGGYHPFKERPRKIVEGFLKRLTPRRRPRLPQGMYNSTPSPTIAEQVYVYDESAPSSVGCAAGSATSTPFEDDQVLRSSAKALAVLGLIDGHRSPSNSGHSPHVSRPQSLASDGHSGSSPRVPSSTHLKTASSSGLRRSDARISRNSPRNRASSRPARRSEASPSAEWPTRPHSADGERATSALPPRRSSLRIPPVRRIESVSGSSSVLSPAPSFSNLWGSRSSSADEVEETWATPPPPPRRRPGMPSSSLSSLSSGQLSSPHISHQSSRSSIDIVNRRSPAGIRSLQHVSTVASHMAEVEAGDSDEILTPRSKAMSTFSSDTYDEQDVVTFDTPRRSRQPTSMGYHSPRVHRHSLVEEGKIQDSIAKLSLDEGQGYKNQRRARAAALAAAADPLKPRRLICEMRSRSRCRASETEADTSLNAPINVSIVAPIDAPVDFTRSPAESVRSIPLPPSPDAFRTWTWNDSETSMPYGRKGCHSPSASVHTFGPGGMSHLRSGSVDTMASLASMGSMASAETMYTVRDSDTVELLYGQYAQPSETCEYDDADRPIDFTRALAYSQPTTWTRPGTPEEYEDHVPVTVSNGVTVW